MKRIKSNRQKIKDILKEWEGDDKAIIDALIAEGLAISTSQAKRYISLIGSVEGALNEYL